MGTESLDKTMKYPTTQFIALGMAVACAKYPELQKDWVTASHRACKGNVSLSLDIQAAGRLDILIRSLEDESLEYITKREHEKVPLESTTTLNTFSALWVGHVYEIYRLLDTKDEEGTPFLDEPPRFS